MVVTTAAASPPSAAVDDGGRSDGSRLGLFRFSSHWSNWFSLCSGYVDLFRSRVNRFSLDKHPRSFFWNSVYSCTIVCPYRVTSVFHPPNLLRSSALDNRKSCKTVSILATPFLCLPLFGV
ncbi:hypothetical protein HanXRQr2_Chr17g0797231 [Helianthus annuus]|uniref:Uncharacterized protein n=1 Tax=Helianthus annuus TaxID=4232 RepID=A0A9K3DGK0_HELAN|nr:hypothetical protein HanXRQr2_Chr17g0797231 [Helianthus annuus]KAJ0812714.1 hypothetical protein HanPSC8_Chr17g0765021 [Helianthus annuus]